jgi:hypothetical protein
VHVQLSEARTQQGQGIKWQALRRGTTCKTATSGGSRRTASSGDTRLAVAEVVEYAVPVVLLHLCVHVEARVPELDDALCKQLDAVHAVAEDDALVDVELAEERVEAVHLLLLFHVRIELAHAPQRELVHLVDHARLAQKLIAEVLDRDGERRAEEHDLAARWHQRDDALERGLELRRQELVRLRGAGSVSDRQVERAGDMGGAIACDCSAASRSMCKRGPMGRGCAPRP